MQQPFVGSQALAGFVEVEVAGDHPAAQFLRVEAGQGPGILVGFRIGGRLELERGDRLETVLAQLGERRLGGGVGRTAAHPQIARAGIPFRVAEGMDRLQPGLRNGSRQAGTAADKQHGVKAGFVHRDVGQERGDKIHPRGETTRIVVRGLDTLPPERLFLEGPAGRLAATLERPAAPPRGAVLHLHPHPLGGGTRRNNVVRYGALGSLEAGCAALRLDFRGAGESEGRHDQGRGEPLDAAAALEDLAARFPGVPLFLWGYSFGAYVALELAPSWEGRLAGVLAVAFPNTVYAWPAENAWPPRAALLCGDRDAFVDLERMAPARGKGVPLTIEPGGDHFFSGRLERVRAFTAARLAEWLG